MIIDYIELSYTYESLINKYSKSKQASIYKKIKKLEEWKEHSVRMHESM